MQSNKHISEFLRYYYELEKPPEYAILLTGLWGSGKTWFIQDFIKQLESKQVEKKLNEILYVSLYGVRSIEDIEAEFFRLLHPVLSSKYMRFMGKLTKGILKTAINFDFNGDGKPEASLTGGMPDVKFYEKVDLVVCRLLVFDDLERCSIPIHDLMGYVNQLIEHGKLKAILIANEEEICSRSFDDNSPKSSYHRTKEKLIGRTFEVIPELAPALEYFINDLPSDLIRIFIKENELIVTQIYESSKFKNLRLLRHSLWEFDRLAETLKLDILENRPLLVELLSIFLVYSFEVHSGSITPSEIQQIQMGLFNQVMSDRKQTSPEEKYNVIRSKYSFIGFYDQLVPNHIWEKVFSTGSIPSEELNQSLLNSKYFNNMNQLNWVKLWHGENLSDEEFNLVFDTVAKEWGSHEYEKLEVVLHVFGILLRFSQLEVCTKNRKILLDEAKKYIDKLVDKNLLSPATIDEITYHDSYEYNREAYAGLGYSSRDTDEFKELLEYVKAQKTDLLYASFPDRANELLTLMKVDLRFFMRRLILNNHKDNEYYQTPILTYIDPNLFVKELMLLNHDERYNIAHTFKERYKFDQMNPKLIDEILWLKNVRDLLSNEMERRIGQISWVSLSEVIMPCLSDAITKLEKFDNRSDLQTLDIPSD
jgi:KAP family P-loop domain